MAQYGLPISDDSTSFWAEGTGDGDGDAFDELDEGFGAGRGSGSGPDDATTYWLTTNEASNTLQTGLSSITDPRVGTGHVYRSRNRKDASGGRQIDCTISLRDNAVLRASEVFANIDNTWTTRSDSLSEAEANLIINYPILSIRSFLEEVGGGSPRIGWESAHEFECPDLEEATPLTLDVADDIDNLADSFTKELAINLTQSAGDSLDNLGDALLKNFEYRKIVGDDSLNLLDSLNKILSYRLIKDDNAFNLSDSLRNVYGLNFLFGDNLDNLDDALIKQLFGNYILDVGDSVNNLSDALVKRLNYLLDKNDSINNLVDDHRIIYHRRYNFADSLDNWLDAVSKVLGGEGEEELTLSLSDNLSNLADTLLLNLNYRKLLVDNILGLADSEIVNLGYSIPKGDSINNLNDSLLLRYGYRLIPADDLDNLLDSLNIRSSLELLKGDSISNWLDSIDITYGYHILSVDILTQSDSLNKRLGYLIFDSDNMGDLLDTLTIQRLHQFLISHGDSFTLSDSLDSITLTEPPDDDQQIVIRLLI